MKKKMVWLDLRRRKQKKYLLKYLILTKMEFINKKLLKKPILLL
jgi:hypothetical protein